MTGWLVAAAMHVGAEVVPRLAPKTTSAAAEVAGAVAYVFGAPARRAAAINLSAVLDPGDPDLVARRVREAFVTQARNYVDLFRVPRLSLAEIERLVDVIGWEHLETALARGQGTVLASVHLGNIDLVAQLACARGLSVTIPVEPLRPTALFRLVQRLRSSHGLRLIPIDEGAPRRLLQALRNGEIVGFAVDRDIQGTGTRMPFFGRPARLSAAPAILALRTGAAILPVGSRRLPQGRFQVEAARPIFPERGQSARALMDELLRPLECFIGRAPGQWVMFQPVIERAEAT